MRVKETIRDKVYETETGLLIKREYGETPNGNNYCGNWVYRDKDNNVIDFSRYRNDLFERNDLFPVYD